MDLKQAKQILTGSETFTNSRLSEERAERHFIYCDAREAKSHVSGAFTADELEAIATWMRDPSGVAGAE